MESRVSREREKAGNLQARLDTKSAQLVGEKACCCRTNQKATDTKAEMEDDIMYLND